MSLSGMCQDDVRMKVDLGGKESCIVSGQSVYTELQDAYSQD